MADNTDEEHLSNPANAQSKNLSNENISTNGNDTLISNQETDNMEV